MTPIRLLSVTTVAAGASLLGDAAFAWGNEGHEIVATIALHYMTAPTASAVKALLAKDTSTLTGHTIAAEATWADAYRSSSTAAYNETHNWHFADIEVPGGTLQAACFDFPPLPAGTAASAGPANDCHVDKIKEDVAELGPSSQAAVAEQVLALKYILHFVGDQHQPLHSADENDAGGNSKKVSATGLGSGNLHAFWDTQFVASYGSSYASVATKLEAAITKANFAAWYSGTPEAWAEDANSFAVSTAYGMLPKVNKSGVYVLPASYVTAAEDVVGSTTRTARCPTSRRARWRSHRPTSRFLTRRSSPTTCATTPSSTPAVPIGKEPPKVCEVPGSTFPLPLRGRGTG